MRIRSLTVVALLAIASAACNKQPAGETKSGSTGGEVADAFGKLTVDEVAQKMDQAKSGKLAFFVYDNNQKADYDKGHVPGAKWVKFDAITANDLPADKEATLVFYCHNEH